MAHKTHKNFITYSARGSATTTAITEAPVSVQHLWIEGAKVGASIIRIRANKTRDEFISSGNTFTGYHTGKTSVYIPLKQPKLKLSFKAKLGLGRINPSMQILEMPLNCDIQPAFRGVREADTGNRLTQAIFG
tara:strand:- start:1507 stop:1905 length:399 start_codon:yes stop_codon:yes gene_type:complete